MAVLPVYLWWRPIRAVPSTEGSMGLTDSRLVARVLCAGAVAICVTLTVKTTPAFETEIHYRSQAALALASGWPIQDALWIAGGDLAIDMNEATVAGLESNTLQATLHQAEKNFHFHCFSRVPDRAEDSANRRNDGVVKHLIALKRDASDALARAHGSPADEQKRVEA